MNFAGASYGIVADNPVTHCTNQRPTGDHSIAKTCSKLKRYSRKVVLRLVATSTVWDGTIAAPSGVLTGGAVCRLRPNALP